MSTDERSPAGAAAPGDGGGSILAAISRDMVALYKEQFGRGPSRSRTHYAGPDTIICLLEDTFTPAERKMVALGEHQRLRDVRTFFQHATVDEFISTIERNTGRRVRGFISGIDTTQDIAVEVFVMHAAGSDGDTSMPPDRPS